MSDPFKDLPRGHFGVILADPPWRFKTWNKATAVKRRASPVKNNPKRVAGGGSSSIYYNTMPFEELAALPVRAVAADNCCLFLWTSWPMIEDALSLLRVWGFTYKTCAFDWMKAHAGQIDMFRDDADALMGMGYWTRANTEPCLLATRGKPKRKTADVRMGVIEPRREHSRKPDCVHGRIERLVDGPYLELFARTARPGWSVWGDEVGKFQQAAE